MRIALTAVVSSLLMSGTFHSAHAGVTASSVTAPDPLVIPSARFELTEPLFQPTNASTGLTFASGLSLDEVDSPSASVGEVTRTDLIRQRHRMQDMPAVEPIPSPSAVASGLVALAALAGARAMRRFKLA